MRNISNHKTFVPKDNFKKSEEFHSNLKKRRRRRTVPKKENPKTIPVRSEKRSPRSYKNIKLSLNQGLFLFALSLLTNTELGLGNEVTEETIPSCGNDIVPQRNRKQATQLIENRDYSSQDLRDWDLSNREFQNCTFTNCKMPSQLENTRFFLCNLGNANFSSTQALDIRVWYSNVEETRFDNLSERTGPKKIEFRNSNCSRSHFENSDLRLMITDSDFRDSNFSGARVRDYYNSRIPILWSIGAKNLNLSDSQIDSRVVNSTFNPRTWQEGSSLSAGEKIVIGNQERGFETPLRSPLRVALSSDCSTLDPFIVERIRDFSDEDISSYFNLNGSRIQNDLPTITSDMNQQMRHIRIRFVSLGEETDFIIKICTTTQQGSPYIDRRIRGIFLEKYGT